MKVNTKLTELVVVKKRTYTIIYARKDELSPRFGVAFKEQGVAYVREDLPIAVQRFVRAHELYHLADMSSWGGWIGSEIRANLVPGLKDPIGFFSTLLLTLLSLDRLRLYLKRFQQKL